MSKIFSFPSLRSMVIISAITSVFFSLIHNNSSSSGIVFHLDRDFRDSWYFPNGILNIIYACMRLYALRVQQRLTEDNQVIYYN